MKAVYVSHHRRPNYEYDWLVSGCDDLTIIDTDFSRYPQQIESVRHVTAQFTENKLVNRFLHSTASLVNYRSFEEAVKSADVIVCLEIFSSLSRQFVEYAKKTQKKSAVIVYELIPNHPIYSLPTHSGNARYVSANADIFICVSKMAASHLLAHGVDSAKIKVVYPGIDTALFSPGPKRSAGTKIIFTGKLAYHKGIDIVLGSYRMLLEEFPDLTLYIAGDGPLQQEVVRFSQQFPGVTFHGRVANNLLPELLRKGDVYILPCRDSFKFGRKIGSEQFGFSLVEAMAVGLPIVSTNCGAIPEVIGSHNLIASQGILDETYNHLRQLLGSVELRKKIGAENARIANQEYTLHVQAKKLASALESTLL